MGDLLPLRGVWESPTELGRADSPEVALRALEAAETVQTYCRLPARTRIAGVAQHFGSAWVEVARVNDQTLHVDVDLAIAVLGSDAELDIDFDLNVGIVCDPEAGTATLLLSTSNLQVDPDMDWTADVLLKLVSCRVFRPGRCGACYRRRNFSCLAADHADNYGDYRGAVSRNRRR